MKKIREVKTFDERKEELLALGKKEGFITFEQMKTMPEHYGKLKTVEMTYNTFRGSRNLNNRNIHVSEYLFILNKEK